MNEFILVYLKTTTEKLNQIQIKDKFENLKLIYRSDQVYFWSKDFYQKDLTYSTCCSPFNTSQEIENFVNQGNLDLVGKEFAYLAFNAETEVITIARDFPGTEPIYYYNDNQKFIVSNDFKKILDIPGLDLSLNDNKIIEHLAGDFILRSETLYKKIFRLNPGVVAKVVDGNLQTISEILPENLIVDYNFSSEIFTDLLSQAIEERQVQSQFAFELSGGLDSTNILACNLSKLSQSANSLSIVFPGMKCDESEYIRKFLEYFPHNNNQFEYKVASLDFIRALIANTAYFPDYPNSLSALPYLEYAQKNNISNIITGVGGDHLFHLWNYNRKPSCYNRIKSKILNKYKLRKLIPKNVLPWLSIDSQCSFLESGQENTFQQFSKLNACQNGILKQIFSVETLEAVESAARVARSYDVYKSHPFFNKDLFFYSLEHAHQQKEEKQILQTNLSKLAGEEWRYSNKAEFTETYLDYTFDNQEYLGVLEQGTRDFKSYLNPTYLNSLLNSKDSETYRNTKTASILWNIIGLSLMKDFLTNMRS